MTDVRASAARSWDLVRRKLAAPTDLAWLAAFRVLFGLVMCTSMLRFIGYGWIDEFWIKPRFHFKYWGFEWVQPLSATGMYTLFWVLAALSLCLAAGFLFRIATFGFFVGFAYIQLLDVTTYLNHYYLAALLTLLLLVSPANRIFAVDAWLSKRPRQSAPFAWLALFRFQVAVVYTFAGLAKAHGDWLAHGHPLRIWLGSNTHLPILGPILTQEWAAPVFSWAGFLFDTFVPWFLMAARTRPYAFAFVIVFHTMTRILFPIGMFPVIMVCSALVFFEADWPRRLLARIRRAPAPPAPASRSEDAAELDGTRVSPWRRAAIGVALLYCAAQLAMPLRFLASGGNVRWHEQGMRFSWRVMVREKNGSVTFLVREKAPEGGRPPRVWHVNPGSYLTRQQEREMSGQPDLILQLAHHIHDEHVRAGKGPVEVRVDAFASLNGRRITRLVDPEVDLAAAGDGIQPKTWILPEPAGPPPHLRPI